MLGSQDHFESPRSPIERMRSYSRLTFAAESQDESIPYCFKTLHVAVGALLRKQNLNANPIHIEQYISMRWPIFANFENGEYLSDMQYQCDEDPNEALMNVDDYARRAGRESAASYVKYIKTVGESQKRGLAFEDNTNSQRTKAPRMERDILDQYAAQQQADMEAAYSSLLAAEEAQRREAEEQANAMAEEADSEVLATLSPPNLTEYEQKLQDQIRKLEQDEQADMDVAYSSLLAAEEAQRREAEEQANAMAAEADPDVLGALSEPSLTQYEQRLRHQIRMLESDSYCLPDHLDPNDPYETVTYIEEKRLAEREAFEALADEIAQQLEAEVQENAMAAEADPDVLRALSLRTDADMPSYESRAWETSEEEAVLDMLAAEEKDREDANRAAAYATDDLSSKVDMDVLRALSSLSNNHLPSYKALFDAKGSDESDSASSSDSDSESDSSSHASAHAQSTGSDQSTDVEDVMQIQPTMQRRDSSNTQVVCPGSSPLSSHELQKVFGVVDLTLDGVTIDLTKDPSNGQEESPEQSQVPLSPEYR